MSLKQKIISASIWILLGYTLSQLIRLASGFIISRLLSPEIFGLMAIVYVIIVAIALMTDVGLTLSVMKSKNTDDPNYLNTIWSVQIVKGVVIFVITIFFSVGFYIFNEIGVLPKNTAYANPLLPFIILALSLNALIAAFDPTWVMLAAKNMQQALITKIEIISQISCALVSILWAWFDKSPWAIVVGMIVGTLSKSLLSHYYNSANKNKWYIDKKFLYEILHFGKWIFLTTLIGFYAINGDRVILGAYVDEVTLGLYAIAYMFYSLVFTIHEKLVGSVIYPALASSYEQGTERLNLNYKKFRLYSDAGLMLLAGMFYAAAQLIINILYDDRYQAAGNILQILAVAIIAMRYRVTEQYFLVINKPYLGTVITTVKAIALILLIPTLFHRYGFDGAVWGVVISTFVSAPVMLYFKYKHQILDIKYELITLPLLVLGWALGYICVWLVEYLIRLFAV